MEINCTVRKATIWDIEELADLLEELFSVEVDFTFDRTKQKKGLELMLDKTGQRVIFVAEVDNQIVGMCSSQLVVSTAEGGISALIEDMVICTQYRSQGIGTLLLSAVENWSVKQGAIRLQLFADKDNKNALSFYKKMNWESTNLIVLRKKINPI